MFLFILLFLSFIINSNSDIKTINNGDIKILQKSTLNAQSSLDGTLWKHVKKDGIWQIPYAFEPTIDVNDEVLHNRITLSQIGVVKNTIQNINSKFKSIKFIEKTNELKYISLGHYKQGCWSFLGDVTSSYPVQPVNLGYGCYTNAAISHELMHVLGFGHEHQRSDRDRYVRILYDNIQTEAFRNFEKLESRTVQMKVPYDYYSILHYPQKAFSKNNNPTVLTKFPKLQERIGRSTDLTGLDVLQTELLYRYDDQRTIDELCSEHVPCYEFEGPCAFDNSLCREGLFCSYKNICMKHGETFFPTASPTQNSFFNESEIKKLLTPQPTGKSLRVKIRTEERSNSVETEQIAAIVIVILIFSLALFYYKKRQNE